MTLHIPNSNQDQNSAAPEDGAPLSLASILMQGQTGKRPHEALTAITALLEESPAFGPGKLGFCIVEKAPLMLPVIAIYRQTTLKGVKSALVYNILPLNMLRCLDRLQTRPITISGPNGTSIACTEFPSRAAISDRVLVSTVAGEIAAKLGIESKNVNTVTAAVVANTIEELTAHPDLILPLVDTANMVLHYTESPETMGIRASHLKGYDLTARFELTPGRTRTDVLGSPVATDFEVSSILRQSGVNSQAEKSMHNEQQSVVLTNAKGIVDLVYTPMQLNHAMGGVTPGFTANLILTDFGSGIGKSDTAETMETVILSLTNVGMLSVRHNWGPLLSDPAQSNIGALGLVYDPLTGTYPNQPAELKISRPGTAPGKSKDTVSYDKVLNSYTLPNAMISLDIEPGGRMYAYHRLFVAACVGDADGMNAIKLINMAVSRLAGSPFNFTGSPVLGSKTLPHGTYLDKNSVRQDIRRSINYLTAIKTFSTDIGMCQEYTLATNFSNPTTQEGMNAYWQLAGSIHPGLEYENIRIRVTINPAWLAAAMAHIASSGLAFNFDGLAFSQQAIQTFDPSVLNQMGVPAGFYTAAQGNGPANSGYVPSNYGAKYYNPGM